MTLHVHFCSVVDPVVAHRFAALLDRHAENLEEGSYVRDPTGALWRVREVRRVTALRDDPLGQDEEEYPRDSRGRFVKRGVK